MAMDSGMKISTIAIPAGRPELFARTSKAHNDLLSHVYTTA